MINNDQEWKAAVLKLAVYYECKRQDVHEAAGYLWETENWGRLKETIHGKFLRELDHKSPDYALRAVYRKALVVGL